MAVTWVWVLTVLTGAVVVVVALWPAPVTPTARFLEFCVVLIAMLLASPHTQRRYFIALFVPMLALLALMRTGRHPPKERLIRVALAVTAAVGTVLPVVFAGRRFALAYQVYSPHLLGPLLMLIALVLVAARMKSMDEYEAGADMDRYTEAGP
jgi:hypothetical protein